MPTGRPPTGPIASGRRPGKCWRWRARTLPTSQPCRSLSSQPVDAKTVEARLDHANTHRFIDDLVDCFGSDRSSQNRPRAALLVVFDAGPSEDSTCGLVNVEQVGCWFIPMVAHLPHQEFAARSRGSAWSRWNTYSTAPGNDRDRILHPDQGGDAGHSSRRDHEDHRADPE